MGTTNSKFRKFRSYVVIHSWSRSTNPVNQSYWKPGLTPGLLPGTYWFKLLISIKIIWLIGVLVSTISLRKLEIQPKTDQLSRRRLTKIGKETGNSNRWSQFSLKVWFTYLDLVTPFRMQHLARRFIHRLLSYSQHSVHQFNWLAFHEDLIVWAVPSALSALRYPIHGHKCWSLLCLSNMLTANFQLIPFKISCRFSTFAHLITSSFVMWSCHIDTQIVRIHLYNHI